MSDRTRGNPAQINPMIYEQVLQARHIAVFITDRDQLVLDSKGDRSVMTAVIAAMMAAMMASPLPGEDAAQPGDDSVFFGHRSWEIIPELACYGPEIAAILEGSLPILKLPWINRGAVDPAPADAAPSAQSGTNGAMAQGSARYLDVTVQPRSLDNFKTDAAIDGLTITVEDTTASGMQHEQMVQTHADLDLLREKIQQQCQELAILNTELAHASRSKSRFVSVAAHELRTPLAAITGYVDLLLDGMFGPLNEEQGEFLHIILGSAHRLLDITNNLLDVTMFESGHLELTLNPFDLGDLINRVVGELRPVFQERDQTVTVQTLTTLGLALIDENRTLQIFSNLIGNASKYTLPGGQITVRVGLADEPGFAQIAIQDTGVGISPEDQGHLFGRFFRAASAQLVNASGAGLGLHITQNLVELHGGHIWFESIPGQGSTFFVTLPLWESQ